MRDFALPASGVVADESCQRELLYRYKMRLDNGTLTDDVLLSLVRLV